jgi:NAD(P)-dependent dehydrogenase (short-subunit alcohol dehydrogenase family)
MSLNPRIADWHGKTVWIVGASTGIGRATALLLHARGARVIVSARAADALQELACAHPGAIPLPMDVTDPQSVSHAIERIDALGGTDGVMYCAGHYRPMRADALDAVELMRHLQVNYIGALNVLGPTLPRLLARPRDTAFVSLVGSVAGYVGLPNSIAYGPTKAALIHLAQTLFLDLRPMGVAVSLINPGFVDTPLTAPNRHAMPAKISAEEAATAILQGWSRGQFEIHFPRRFSLAMKLLALLPARMGFYLIHKVTGL